MSRPEDGSALDSGRGWVIVATSFLVLFVLWGAVFTYTVYAEALATTFGLSPLRVSAVFSVGTAAFFVAGGAVGILAARVPLRRVVAASAAGVAVAVVALQFVESFYGLLAAFSVFGVASGTMFVVVISLVPQWFDVYEGRAMGLTVTGNGLGVQVMPFVWLWLLARTDVRGAFLVVGGTAVVVLVAAAAVFRRPPGQGRTASVGWAWIRTLVGDGRFVAAWVGLVLAWSWYLVLSAGLVDILVSAGIVRSVAATAFGLIGGVSIASRVASGGLADRIGPRRTLAAGIVLAGVGVLLLSVTTTRPTMYAAIVTFGAGLGAIAALYAPIVIRAFDPENATAVTGVFTFCSAVAGFLAPLGVNALAQAVGGFSLPLAVLGALTFLGAWLFYWGTDPSVEAGARVPMDRDGR